MRFPSLCYLHGHLKQQFVRIKIGAWIPTSNRENADVISTYNQAPLVIYMQLCTLFVKTTLLMLLDQMYVEEH